MEVRPRAPPEPPAPPRAAPRPRRLRDAKRPSPSRLFSQAQLGNPSEAAALFQKGLALQPTARLYHALGVLQDSCGQADAARASLRAGLALPGEDANPQLLHALGVEVRAGKPARARAHWRAALDASPTFTLAHVSLGQPRNGWGTRRCVTQRSTPARLGESVDARPISRPPPLTPLSPQAARRHYAEGATVATRGGGRGTVQLWQAWARVEASLGQRAHAERLYERACKYYPRDAELPLQWGKMCAAEAARLRAALAAAEVGVDPIDAREAAAAEDDNDEAAAGEAPLGAAAARGEQMGVARSR